MAGGWVSWHGRYYDIPEMTIEPHPPAPVPVLCGGESDAALERAARLCDGWVGTAYTLDEAEHVIGRLNRYRREHGRENEPFDIIATVRGEPSPDLYERAAELGITGVMVSPWANWERTHAGGSRASEAARRTLPGTHRAVRRGDRGEAAVEALSRSGAQQQKTSASWPDPQLYA